MFGGNSNWRGPVWMPVNTLIVRALLNLYSFYGDDFTVECPTGSSRKMTLATGAPAASVINDGPGIVTRQRSVRTVDAAQANAGASSSMPETCAWAGSQW
jgi:hypothetical protein